MAATIVDEKAVKPSQLSVDTASPGSNSPASEPTPVSGSTTPYNEKHVRETGTELSRNSTLSTPSSVHQLNPYDTDVEAIMPQSCENLNRKSTSCPGKPNQECPVWPGQNHWKQKARAAKINNRSCQCMARYSKRTRLILKLLIAFLIIGIAVGVGLGISKPLGAGIWKPKDS